MKKPLSNNSLFNSMFPNLEKLIQSHTYESGILKWKNTEKNKEQGQGYQYKYSREKYKNSWSDLKIVWISNAKLSCTRSEIIGMVEGTQQMYSQLF